MNSPRHVLFCCAQFVVFAVAGHLPLPGTRQPEGEESPTPKDQLTHPQIGQALLSPEQQENAFVFKGEGAGFDMPRLVGG